VLFVADVDVTVRVVTLAGGVFVVGALVMARWLLKLGAISTG